MTSQQLHATAALSYTDEVSPDSLMGDFRGRPIVAILAFTVIVHAVLIGVFSLGYLKNQVLGQDTSGMNKEERLDIAVREATTSLREIAERHDVSPQELSDRFAKGDARPAASPRPGQPDSPPTGPESPDVSKEPGSAIEKELDKTEVGPELPDLPSENEEDDLF